MGGRFNPKWRMVALFGGKSRYEGIEDDPTLATSEISFWQIRELGVVENWR
ncbi:hypothetical protein BofuT4_uP044000.1 [Botrytis cinerea T4]|uniref:Uncharacterized protein n=1 Tax=Botryotinia fuckeliana (strain T4) TaxID=999810 RepID=G2Y059_BOTF4|nr:hypothetical protein BofuT4_uP044000.1 [Botrytis cinerea T4]